MCGAMNLGLRSSNSLQPRLSHGWLSVTGKKPLVNVDKSMRWGILIVVSHFVSFVCFCDRLSGCPDLARGGGRARRHLSQASPASGGIAGGEVLMSGAVVFS